MNKFKVFLLSMLAVRLMATPSMAAMKNFHAEVYRDTGKMSVDGKPELELITSGVTYRVLAKNADTIETLYDTKTKAAKSVTAAAVTTTTFAVDDAVDFACDPTDSADEGVDLIVTDTAGGFTKVVKNFTQYDHTIIIDERPNVMHTGIIWFDHDNADADAQHDTGIDFKINTFITDVRIEVVTLDDTETIDVGTADDPNGFLAARSLAAAGYVTDTGVITGGNTIDYVPATTYGVLLYTAITGSDAVATVGGRSYIGHLVKTAGTNDDLVYDLSAGSDTAHGYIFYNFIQIR